MTEVPEHLLQRARARRAALSGEEAPAGAVEPAQGASPAAAGAAPAASAAAPARPRVPEVVFTGPPPPPPRTVRVPFWAMPVLAVLPFWGLMYGGAFGERDEGGANDPLTVGAEVYTASCAGCHGPAGEGGAGPPMGAVNETFPDFADHVTWVEEGSAAVAGQTYGATNRPATGGMPGFASQLSPAEITAVVCHERVTMGGAEVPDECLAPAAGEPGAEGEAASH